LKKGTNKLLVLVPASETATGSRNDCLITEPWMDRNETGRENTLRTAHLYDEDIKEVPNMRLLLIILLILLLLGGGFGLHGGLFIGSGGLYYGGGLGLLLLIVIIFLVL
jgi:hypothetical protein